MMMSSEDKDKEYLEAMEAVQPKLIEMFEKNAFDVSVTDLGSGKLLFMRGDKPLVFDTNALESMILYINSFNLLMGDTNG